MAEVTYFVALPFVAADDGIAAGEPTECFNPNAFDRMPGEWRGRRVPAAVIFKWLLDRADRRGLKRDRVECTRPHLDR
jgi:hypothetical protein